MNKKIILSMALVSIFSNNSFALTLKESVKDVLTNNPKIKSLNENSNAYKYYVDEAIGDYYPKINYEGYWQDKKITDNASGANKTHDENGSNQQITLDQNLYNGGMTKAKVEEAKYNEQATLIFNIKESEKLILDTVFNYLDYIKYEELKLLTENSLDIKNRYLETAIETEKVSGDVVDRLEVEAKILASKTKITQLKIDKNSSKELLEKNISVKVDERICRPKLHDEYIPTNLEIMLNEGVKRNYRVVEELQKINAQKAIISQELARFMPAIDVRLMKELDRGIDTDNVNKDNESVRVTLKFNLFNGLKDYSVYEREKIFLAEAQQKLDDLTKETNQVLKSEFTKYNLLKEKISILKEQVEKGKEILKHYSEQFEGGTRSFIDVLNQEEDLYRKKSELIEDEYNLYSSYYTLLFELSKLSDSIISEENQKCEELLVDYRVIEKKPEIISEELQNLLLDENESELKLDDNIEEKTNKEEDIKNKVNKVFNSILDDIYSGKEIEQVTTTLAEPKEEKIEVSLKNEPKEEKEEAVVNIDEDEKIVQERVEASNLDENISKENIEEIKDEFFKDSENKFTIVLATIVNSEVSIDKILNKYKLKDELFAYKFYKNGKSYVKVLYGSFKSKLEAREAIANFDKRTLKNSPYIDNVSKHERLFKENNSMSGDVN